VEVGDSTCGVADRGYGPHFQKGALAVLQESHCSASQRKFLPIVEPQLQEEQCWGGGGHGSLPIWSTCALWTWSRLMTVSIVGGTAGVWGTGAVDTNNTVLGMSDWEETPGQTQNPLEGLYISSGLGIPQDLPGGAGVLLGRRKSGGPA